MADPEFEQGLVADLIADARAVGQLAGNEEAFLAAYKAFRAENRPAFQAALKRTRPAVNCGFFCEWIRIKECVFLCLELCGPPPAQAPKAPDPRAVAEAIMRITSNERLLAQLVEAVEKRDAKAFRAFVRAQKLDPYCHLFCHWVCVVRYRLLCGWLCDVKASRRPNLAAELEGAGKALATLLQNRKTFAAAASASQAGDAEKLRAVLADPHFVPFCRWICEFFCTWRCVLVCLQLCRESPLRRIENEAQEALAFARATAPLVQQEAQLKKLSAAIGSGDVKTFESLVARLKLQPYCMQLCHWICFLRCRHFCRLVCPPLVCDLTAPTGCVKEESDVVTGRVFVRVKGSASGSDFGSYTIEVTQNGDPPVPGIVSYPGGGASGVLPVVNGELAQINTVSLVDGAYTVTLTVHPKGPGSPCIRTITFNLLKVFVVISKVGKIPAITMAPVPDNPNPFDEAAALRKDYAAAPPPHDYELVAVGDSISIDGAAYIYGCTSRKITKYEIRYARVLNPPGVDYPQPATLAPIPATWPVANRLELLEYTLPDQYQPWTRTGLAPRNLINSWGTITFPGPTTYYYLEEQKWNSAAVASGRYSLLLTAEDSIGARFHDIQHVWLDNEPVYALVTAITGVAPCADLRLSQFVRKGMTVEGIAWDRLIDDAFPDSAPNDNFDHYRLTLYKQGGGSHVIGDFTNRVISPFRKTGPPPTAAEAGDLATFDVVSVIDAGTSGSDSQVNIPRRTGCAYYFLLEVWDKTRLNDDTATHYSWSIWPFCITNDIT
jgi:hypothetical protein